MLGIAGQLVFGRPLSWPLKNIDQLLALCRGTWFAQIALCRGSVAQVRYADNTLQKKQRNERRYKMGMNPPVEGSLPMSVLPPGYVLLCHSSFNKDSCV